MMEKVPTDFVPRLIRAFGLGTDQSAALNTYRWIKRCCEHHHAAYAVVRQLAGEAADKEDPGRYFRASASRRLRECGLTPPAVEMPRFDEEKLA